MYLPLSHFNQTKRPVKLNTYELSCFSGHDRKRVKIKSLISYIKTCGDPGDDLAHCFYKYWEKQVGISRDDLDYFIMRMIDFDAEEAQDYDNQ
ncbi:MAG: hypothetical protein MJZ74_06540 [Muribaculaceae bacterium]|nr:hypothetical protein [Muribaculaceae bacterium]